MLTRALPADKSLRGAMRRAFAALIGGCMVVIPVVALANNERSEPLQIPGSADAPVTTTLPAGDGKAHVSPYAKASRQHAEDPRAEHTPSMVIIVGGHGSAKRNQQH